MAWPKYLHVPGPREFRHGDFGVSKGWAYTFFNPAQFRFVCGTRACLVGHIAVAFDAETSLPLDVQRVPEAVQFARRMADLAGKSVPEGMSDEYALQWVSDIFEPAYDHHFSHWDWCNEDGFYSGLNPDEAHDLYVRTAESFGYTVDVSVEEARRDTR